MEIIIKQEELQRRIKELALEITEDYKSSGNSLPPVLICVLNGAFMFFTDLVRNMPIDCEIDFIRLKSYNGQDNSGGVMILKEPEDHAFLIFIKRNDDQKIPAPKGTVIIHTSELRYI